MKQEIEVIKLKFFNGDELFLPLRENVILFGVDSFEKLKQIWLYKDWFGLKINSLELTISLVENPSEVKTDPHWKIKCFESKMYSGYYWSDRKALFACWYTYEFGGSSGINKYDDSCTTPR